MLDNEFHNILLLHFIDTGQSRITLKTQQQTIGIALLIWYNESAQGCRKRNILQNSQLFPLFFSGATAGCHISTLIW
jgi:hypothetical protein